MATTPPKRLLRVQTVLFEHGVATLWRLLRGLDAAARNVIEADLVDGVEWALGDSSPAPVMTESDASAMQDATSALSGVSYEHFGENLGSSGGQNRLAVECNCDFLLVLNPDTYPSPNALTELVSAIERGDAGVVEARQIPLEHPRAYDTETWDTGWASGFCMLVRAGLFDELGGFDHANFLLHCDDVDFSWRVRAAGHRVMVAPYATVFHDKRPTLDAAWPAPDAEVYHAALGRLMLARKWDRQDVVDETIAQIEAGDSRIQHQALAAFRARLANGRVPDPEPNAAAVAEFIDGEYARHRF